MIRELQAGPLYFGGVTLSRANQHPAFSFTNRVLTTGCTASTGTSNKASRRRLVINNRQLRGCLSWRSSSSQPRAARVPSSTPGDQDKHEILPDKGEELFSGSAHPHFMREVIVANTLRPPCGYDRHHPTCGGIRQTHITAGGTDGAVDDCRVLYIIKRRGRASAASTDFEPQVEQSEL